MDGLEIGLKDGMPEVVAEDEANQSDVVAEQESQQQAMELLMEGVSSSGFLWGLPLKISLTPILLNCFGLFFIHLKLELLTQFPAANDEK